MGVVFELAFLVGLKADTTLRRFILGVEAASADWETALIATTKRDMPFMNNDIMSSPQEIDAELSFALYPDLLILDLELGIESSACLYICMYKSERMTVQIVRT